MATDDPTLGFQRRQFAGRHLLPPPEPRGLLAAGRAVRKKRQGKIEDPGNGFQNLFSGWHLPTLQPRHLRLVPL